ncbi:beta-1,3-galactosyltransferase 1-like [Elysia marginata]|uniref:Hexosyltransferase n=1 Tax=Elysia marginata TaxID=1093978 RepID=A0AAV4HVL3_9GAST|nr:beta-1,3-galactosyltransferase 1-like [Elysia marginata]
MRIFPVCFEWTRIHKTFTFRRCLVFATAALVISAPWLLKMEPRTNTRFPRNGTTIGDQELLGRVNKHAHHVLRTPKHILEHEFFSPNPFPLETYNNSVLREPSFVNKESCGSVHVIIPSTPDDVKTRDVIRETWGSVALGLRWPGKPLSLTVRITFVLGVTDKNNRNVEDVLHDDILQFDVAETYRNLTRKILLSLQWVLSSCKDVQYVVKVDQDTFANLPLLLSFLKHHGEGNSIYGYIYPGGSVNRGTTGWGVSKELYPLDQFPVYASGTAYVMSKSAVETLIEMSPHFLSIPIEDAFITGVLATAGSVDRVHVDGFTHWSDSKIRPCAFINDDQFFGSNMAQSDLITTWQNISTGVKC